jgi:hypothetical protein
MRYTGDLKWQLERGSHEFPTRNGETCISETAVVALGLNTGALQPPATRHAVFPVRSSCTLRALTT